MQCSGKGDLLERFGPYTRVVLERDPEVCGRDIAWHRDILDALPEERCAYRTSSRGAGQEGTRCCVCGMGCITDPVVMCGASGAIACRVCANSTQRHHHQHREEEAAEDFENMTLARAVLGEEEGEDVAALIAAAANLRKELEGMLEAAGMGEGEERGGAKGAAEATKGFREWVEEALRTLGCVDAGIAALRENRCGTWDAAERTLAAAAARIQHIQNMLA